MRYAVHGKMSHLYAGKVMFPRIPHPMHNRKRRSSIGAKRPSRMYLKPRENTTMKFESASENVWHHAKLVFGWPVR
jgi:hypothetical protein